MFRKRGRGFFDCSFRLARPGWGELFYWGYCMDQLVVVRAFGPYGVGDFVPEETRAVVLAGEHAGHVVAVVLPQQQEG